MEYFEIYSAGKLAYNEKFSSWQECVKRIADDQENEYEDAYYILRTDENGEVWLVKDCNDVCPLVNFYRWVKRNE